MQQVTLLYIKDRIYSCALRALTMISGKITPKIFAGPETAGPRRPKPKPLQEPAVPTIEPDPDEGDEPPIIIPPDPPEETPEETPQRPFFTPAIPRF